jgi:hypothetical protein
MDIAAFIVTLARWWLYAGAGVAVAFLLIGIDRVDANARGSYTFRPLLVPAILLIWPLVLWRWYVLEAGRADWRSQYNALRDTHAPVWFALALLIPMIFVVALAVRQPWPADTSAVQISAPGK